MTKTFRKFISFILVLLLMLSISPMGILAEEDAAGAVKLEFLNPVWVYKTTSGVQNYSSYLYASPLRSGIGSNDAYRSFFQLDFSGYEYLLRDPGTKINMSIAAAGPSGTRLCNFDMYILDDSNDAYGEHYIPYSDGTYGMKYNNVFDYVKSSVLTGNKDNFTPFVSRVNGGDKAGGIFVTSDANMQVLADALDAATDDSIVTIQFVHTSGTKNYSVFKVNNAGTYLQLIPTANPEATPAKYVADTKNEIAWSMISSDESNNLRSDLNLAGLTKYKGIDITWSSSDPKVLNAETGVVTRNRADNNITLTANLSYTDYTGGVTTDSVDFNVTVPAISIEEQPVFGNTVNQGDTVLGFRSGASYRPSYNGMESVKEGLGGKDETDAYLVYGDVGGTRELNKATATGAQDVIEYSVYVPSGSKGMSTSIYIDDINGNYKGETYVIKNDGIFVSFSTGLSKLCELTPDKWHSLAFVTPNPYVDSAAENDNKLKIYVDGIKRSERVISYGKIGLKYNVRLNSRRASSSAEPPAIYLDNLRVHSNPYAPEYDMLDEISYKDGIDGDKIIVKGKITVGDLKSGITKKSDTTIRIYRKGSDVLLSDEAYIEQGDVVVAAAKNGSEMERSYNYYSIKMVDFEVVTEAKVNGEVANVYDSDDILLATTKVSNYTETDTYNVRMYAAQYKGGDLIGIWESASELNPGETKILTCDFEGIKDRAGSNIKIIVTDSNLNPFVKPATMRYKSGKDKATLWLLGDSTVQDYEDKILDPIQGWGFHIGSFLNENITVKNRARGGWTTDHYLYPDNVYTREDGVNSAGDTLNIGVVGKEYRYCVWENVKKEISRGDYLILNLGINDSGATNGEYRVSRERFKENVETIYAEATALGATVIFATPVPSGGSWDTDSFSFPGGRQNFGKTLTSVAEQYNFVCLPFGATVYGIYNDMVAEYLSDNEGATKVEAYNYVRNYFHLFMSKGTPPEGYQYGGSGNDSTHHNTVASKHLAKILAQLLVESGSPLGDYVVGIDE